MTPHEISFPVSEQEAMQADLVWRGVHNHINWEIKYWGYGTMCDGHGMWNFYIIIPRKQLPNGFNELCALTDDYYNSPLARLPWHGEITFCKVEKGADAIKAGCDYGHHFDSAAGYPYSLELVKRETFACCEALTKLYPQILARCGWDGTYHPRDEMVQHDENSSVFFWKGNMENHRAANKWCKDTLKKLSLNDDS